MFDLARFLKGLSLTSETDPTKQLNIQISPSATTGTVMSVVAAQTASRTLTLPDITGTVSTSNSTETLTNKTIDGDDNTLQDIGIASLKTNLSDASKFIVRDASGVVVSNIKAVPAGAVVGSSDSQTLTNKTIDASANTVSNIVNANIGASAAIAVTKLAAQTASRAVTTDGSGFLTPSATTATELGYVSGVTSAIQTQLDSKTSITGSFTDNHVIRADGTAGVQNSAVVIDDSANITGANSATLGLVTIGVGASNKISTSGTGALLLTNGGSSSQVVFTDKPFQISSPTSGLAGQLVMSEDQASGHATTATIQPAASMASNRTITFPDATTTLVGTDATQTLSAKTFSDALTLTQISTPSSPLSGKDKLYVKSDDRVYVLTSGGTETKLVQDITVVSSNSGLSATQPSASDVWANVVGNSVSLTAGTWELNACLNYSQNGATNPGYSNHYGYWCAATGTNTSTAPAALSTLTGLTVVGGYQGAVPFIANSSTDQTSIVNMPAIVITLTQSQTIFVGMRAVMSTAANARFIPTITAKRIG